MASVVQEKPFNPIKICTTRWWYLLEKFCRTVSRLYFKKGIFTPRYLS